METGAPLLPEFADDVAAAMKAWALSKGANYFAHVFYPLTGATAEKHHSFIVTDASGKAITEFNGSLLTKGEPDGSSFPNGGIRQTKAARGYTFWDPTSPAYILERANGETLCIPSVFVSWTGEALDKKVPLMRSNLAMNKAGARVLKLMGEAEIAPLNSSCGAEQEHFLVDTTFANLRPDLLLAGRTLFGAAPAKGQEFEDHYFAAIPERVQVYLEAVEENLYRLGIPAINAAQRSCAWSVRDRTLLRSRKRCDRSPADVDDGAKQHGPEARLYVPVAREAICWREWLRQTRELVGGQRHTG